MGETDLRNILTSFKKMKGVTQRLISYLKIFQSNSDFIYTQIKTSDLIINQEEYRRFIESIPHKLSMLNSICIDLDELIDNISTLELDEITLHYKNFLRNEIVNSNWNNLVYTDDYSYRIITNFINKINDTSITYSNEDHNAIEYLNKVRGYIEKHLILLQNKISGIKVFDKVKAIENNIVLIGANGSGKSTFARNLRGKLSDNITILSAQHLLIYTKPKTISLDNSEIEAVYNFQSSSKLGSDSNLVNLFSNDLNNLISALFSENGDREHYYYVGKEDKQDSMLIKSIKIWNEIIIHRRLEYSRHCINVSTLDGITYDFNYLSDGEKAVFYYIAHVLLAKKDSYIIIDEPESHLHLAICDKLWDLLEQERRDCKFIYITHNLDFATTRNNKVILWNKKFIPPSEWDVSMLEQDEHIPERLLMELVGSRKDILFCEGNDKTSLDYKLYSILFPQFTIIPVGGHLNVINYCMAYNKNKTIYGQEAIGIIDGDCHLLEQTNKWHNNKIYTLQVNEIENLLCDEFILRSAAKRFCSKENAIENFKTKFFNELKKDKTQQAVWFANNTINNYFKQNMLKEKKELSSLKSELTNVVNEDMVQQNYDYRLEEIEKFINTENFIGALKICNFKGKLIGYIATEIVDDYKERIFTHISTDKNLQEEIKEKYFSFLN